MYAQKRRVDVQVCAAYEVTGIKPYDQEKYAQMPIIMMIMLTMIS